MSTDFSAEDFAQMMSDSSPIEVMRMTLSETGGPIQAIIVLLETVNQYFDREQILLSAQFESKMTLGQFADEQLRIMKMIELTMDAMKIYVRKLLLDARAK